MRNLSKIITLISLFLFSQELENDSTTKSYDLYYIENDCIEIPSELLAEVSVKSGDGEKYSVSGNSVACKDGIVKPKCTYTYWYGTAGYIEPFEGQEPDAIEKACLEGVSTVTVTGKDYTHTYEFNVRNYGLILGNKKINDFIEANVTKEMTDLEKFEKISEFTSFIPYVESNTDWLTTWDSTINCHGGSNAGLNKVLVLACKMVGLSCHLRFGGNEPSKERAYRNVAALIGDKIYISNAGDPVKTIPREFKIVPENIGYYFNDAADKKITILQYDGFDEDIVVPETIDGNTVVSIGSNCFYYGQSTSGMPVKSIKLPKTLVSIADSAFYGLSLIKTLTLPASLEKIGDKAFYYNQNLTEINVEAENKNFWSFDGVLFDNNKTKLLIFPTAKGESYTGHEGLSSIGDNAFYYCSGVKKVILPPSLTNIGTNAFTNSKVKEIYFGGDPPVIATNAFSNLELTIYYPQGNQNWGTSSIKNGAKNITFKEWNPTSFPKPGEKKEEGGDKKDERGGEKKEEKKVEEEGSSSTVIIVVIVVVVILIILIAVFLIIRKRKRDAVEKNAIEFQTGQLVN